MLMRYTKWHNLLQYFTTYLTSYKKGLIRHELQKSTSQGISPITYPSSFLSSTFIPLLPLLSVLATNTISQQPLSLLFQLLPFSICNQHTPYYTAIAILHTTQPLLVFHFNTLHTTLPLFLFSTFHTTLQLFHFNCLCTTLPLLFQFCPCYRICCSPSLRH